MQPLLSSAVVGYLLGSIPFGYLLVRGVLKTDVRTTGSGNIGATNVARTSPALGATTLLLDALKGTAAVWIAISISPGNRTAGFVAAVAAISGHVFPVWLRFRGGKGVATGLGAFLFLTPKAIMLALAVFLVLVILLRYVSVASIMAAASLPLLAFITRETPDLAEFVLVFAGSLLIIVKHTPNIRRLFAGTEPRFQARRK